MIKKLLISIFIIFSLLICNAQNENSLYLIQAHVFDDLGGMFQFNNYLYKLNNRSVDTIAELSSEKEYLYSVKYYPEIKKILYYKDGWKYNKNKYLGIIDCNTLKTYSVRIGYDSYKIMDGILTRDKNVNLFVLDLFGRKQNPNEVYLGFNLADSSKSKLQANIYMNINLEGSSGGVMMKPDYMTVYTNSKDGKLFIPQSPKIEDRPVFPLEIPDSLRSKEKRMVLILINNQENFVVSMGASDPKPEQIGFTKIIIKDKKGDHWFSYKLKGNSQVMRCFGSWLAGSVVDENIRLILDEKGAVKDKEVFSRVSPGKEVRKREVTSSGTTFDIRADYLGVYYPGILYLLNVPTRKYLEWNTGQGDSEILLVQDEIVYYRVNNEIFKAPILNGEKLGNSELLLKDFRVPDIHWAFFSNK